MWFWEVTVGSRSSPCRADVARSQAERAAAAASGACSSTFTGEWPALPSHLPAPPGNLRIGIASEQASIAGPVGSCQNSYGLRDVNGARVHCGTRRGYADRRLRPGDVIGVLLALPPDGLVPAASDRRIDADMSAAAARAAGTQEGQHETAAVPGEAWLFAFTAFGAALQASAPTPVFPLQAPRAVGLARVPAAASAGASLGAGTAPAPATDSCPAGEQQVCGPLAAAADAKGTAVQTQAGPITEAAGAAATPAGADCSATATGILGTASPAVPDSAASSAAEESETEVPRCPAEPPASAAGVLAAVAEVAPNAEFRGTTTPGRVASGLTPRRSMPCEAAGECAAGPHGKPPRCGDAINADASAENAHDRHALDAKPEATAWTPSTATSTTSAPKAALVAAAPEALAKELPGALGPLPRAIAPRHELLHGGLAEPAAAAEPASSVRFFINGRPCGVAFAGLTPALRYFPAASCLRGGAVTLNPGPEFVCPPRKGEGPAAWRPLSEAADDQAAAADGSAR